MPRVDLEHRDWLQYLPGLAALDFLPLERDLGGQFGSELATIGGLCLDRMATITLGITGNAGVDGGAGYQFLVGISTA